VDGAPIVTGWTDAQAGARRQLDELYQRCAPAGLRLAFLLTGDPGLAEDLVQEAFARLIGRLRHLREPSAFDAYLRRTIVNLSASHFRHQAVVRAYERRYAAGESETREPDVVEYEAMRRALLGLPERQRAAIVLRFYEDLPETEVAEILRCRPGTVRSLVTRGVHAMRPDLERVNDE
jgi:RNA polymerase sigma-70 factor (sigma-E family)